MMSGRIKLVFGSFKRFPPSVRRFSEEKRDVVAALVQSIDSLKEAIKSESEDRRAESAAIKSELKAQDKRFEDKHRQTMQMIKDLNGAVGDFARSTLHEVGAAVLTRLVREGRKIIGVHYGKEWGSDKKIEVDCLIEMDDVIAVIEAKLKVTEEAFGQLEETSKHIELVFGKPVMMFLGGHNFEHSLRETSLSKGIYVVATGGGDSRFSDYCFKISQGSWIFNFL